MKYILALAMVICTISAGSRGVLAQSGDISDINDGAVIYFEELYDIPVLDGMTVLTQQAMSFDKPDGRISQAVAFSDNKSWEEVLSFYKATLVEMGWKHTKDASFTRESELLEMSHEQEDSGLIIRFLLRPL